MGSEDGTSGKNEGACLHELAVEIQDRMTDCRGLPDPHLPTTAYPGDAGARGGA